MIRIIRNPKPEPVKGFIECPSMPPMKCMVRFCVAVGYVCHLYKGKRTEFWK